MRYHFLHEVNWHPSGICISFPKTLRSAMGDFHNTLVSTLLVNCITQSFLFINTFCKVSGTLISFISDLMFFDKSLVACLVP